MNNGLKSLVMLLNSAGDGLEHRAKKVRKIRKKQSKRMARVANNGRKRVLYAMGIASVREMNKVKKEVKDLSERIETVSN